MGDMEHIHTKSVLNRTARAIGHLNSIKTMIENGRDCSEILIQLSAVRSEITNLSKIILKEHIDHTYFIALGIMIIGAWLCSDDKPLLKKNRC